MNVYRIATSVFQPAIYGAVGYALCYHGYGIMMAPYGYFLGLKTGTDSMVNIIKDEFFNSYLV